MKAAFTRGTTFAGYRIEELVGRGGMGVVYRATDLSLERPVALKLIAPELAEDERFRSRFLREPRLAASLDHPNVIPIYDAGEHDGQLYLVMRFVEGSDLRTLIDTEGKLGPERTLAILAQVAGALDAAHRRALVHRDVKPANVLLDARRPRLSHRLRHHQAARGRLDRYRPARRDARLPRARADPRRTRGRPHGLLRARVRAVRMSGRQAAVPARHRGGDHVGAHAGAAGAASRPWAARTRCSERRWRRTGRTATRAPAS